MAQFLSESLLTAFLSLMVALSNYLAAIAIGLATFTVERRLKEIGIRKILGSSDFGIVRLLSTDFTKMVLMAIVIALPISYFIAKNWLSTNKKVLSD